MKRKRTIFFTTGTPPAAEVAPDAIAAAFARGVDPGPATAAAEATALEEPEDASGMEWAKKMCPASSALVALLTSCADGGATRPFAPSCTGANANAPVAVVAVVVVEAACKMTGGSVGFRPAPQEHSRPAASKYPCRM